MLSTITDTLERPIGVMHVVGARPNFMKVAPLMRALEAHKGFAQTLVHTGQHYDAQMSDVFFEHLGLPAPDVHLEVGSGTHGVQTAQIMQRFEPVVSATLPDWVVVVGDVNSTLACALVCAKLGVRVAHVEAGLRSFDRSMPEEINRMLTDQVADLLLTSEEGARGNLLREGVAEEKIHFVGNIMIDTLIRLLPEAEDRPVLGTLGLAGGKDGATTPFILVTLHRPANVDHPATLREIALALGALATQVEVIFPVHPRTRERMRTSGVLEALGRCRVLDPLGYLDFLALERRAALVVTDSGGVQEETTWLGVPCLTVRPNTERPATISIGTNELVAASRATILDAARARLNGSVPVRGRRPPLWDGRTAERIASVMAAQEVRG